MSSTNALSVVLYLAIGGLIPLTIRLLHRKTIQITLPGPPGGNLFSGHLERIIGPAGPDYQEHMFSTYGTTMQIRGLFYSKALFTIDPMVIGTVLIKEKNKFERSNDSNVMMRSIFGGRGGLLGIASDEHRIQRKVCDRGSPIAMITQRWIVLGSSWVLDLPQDIFLTLPVFMNTAKKVCAFVSRELSTSESPKDVDVLRGATSATIDCIGEVGFGYAFNSFKDERNPYSDSIQEVTQSLIRIGPLIQLLPYVHQLGTAAFRRWMLDVAPFDAIRQLWKAVCFQHEQADKILRTREELISSGVDISSEAGGGKDIITLLMKAEGIKTSVDREILVGHMNVFIAAGHESTSTAIVRILDELAHHQDIQNSLRDELNYFFDNNADELDSKGLLELPYLDGVVREVLRLYPPFTIITRVCQEDTVLPLAYPINTSSGKISTIPIKKGTVVFLNSIFYNRHEEIWGERAGDFLPERWIGKKLNEVTETELRLPGVYSSMMTFGAGSYGCIGIKFAVMEISCVDLPPCDETQTRILMWFTLETIIAELVRKFKFGPATQECTWLNIGMQFPYLKADLDNPKRSPKLFLKVDEL
ncbi:unnamed protein product [Rhizoctonia solani]|uniref:Uncharacterized protein n=1 Tax=Rhizoctonia solani TaxID=456999 RepID=A0A8H3B9Y3_9AGAM|nr:unnamed protein product [Rhizoctonia solani]